MVDRCFLIRSIKRSIRFRSNSTVSDRRLLAYTGRPKSLIPTEMPVGQEISPILQTLKQLLDSYLVMPEVDTQRVYIIGLSMGAMGTYDLVVRYPEIFAAAVPICGTVNPSRYRLPRM